MFSALLALSTSINVIRCDVGKAVEMMKTGSTFLLALSSNDYEYPTYSRYFIRSAHHSTVEAQFAIVDTSSAENALDQLSIKQTPALIYVENGVVLRAQYRGFDDDFIGAFINSNFVAPIQTIQTEEELTSFYRSTAVGLIVAQKDATQEKYPELVKFYRDNFYDTAVVFANPELFEKEGFYLYRYLDSELVELPDLSTATPEQITNALNEESLPELSRINTFIAADYERSKQIFAILMLSMDDFYLSQENLELAHAIKDKANINVTYTDIENSQFVGINYGLPDSLDSTLAIIDASGQRVMKYMLPNELTIENALALIESVKQGTATPFWKSELEPIVAKGELQVITANTLTQIIKDKKDVLVGVYYSSTDPIEPYVNATREAVKDPKNVVYGKFSVARNDWSGPIVGDDLPFLVCFKAGKVTYAQKMAETEEEVSKQIKEALEKNDEL